MSPPRPGRAPASTPGTAGLRISLVMALLVGAVAFGWPLFLRPASSVPAQLAPIVFAAVLVLVLAIVLAELSSGRMDVKTLAMLGVLAAVGTVLRPLSAGAAGLELIFFVIILAGRAYGASFGFALGAITLFTSALITSGVGPWLPYQMLCAGFVGLFAGLLPRASGRAELVLLAVYGVVSAFVYGWLTDFSFWPFAIGGGTELSFDPTRSPVQNLHRFLLFNLATSMGWNLGRALANATLIMLFGTSLLHLFRRSARTARLGTPETVAIAAPGRNSACSGPVAGYVIEEVQKRRES